MRAHKAVRAAVSAEGPLVSLRSYVSRPRFQCLNAPSRALAVGRGNGRERFFSQSTIRTAGAAEAV
jgi:elongation factor G